MVKIWLVIFVLRIPGYGTIEAVLPTANLSYVFSTEKQCKDYLSTILSGIKPEVHAGCEFRLVGPPQ